MRAMKDSGIEWIGQIPKNWNVGKLGFFIEALNGDRSSNYPSGNDLQDSGIPFLTSNNLESDVLSLNDCKYISEEKYSAMSGLKVKIDDIIYCLRGSVGKCSINKSINEGTVASSLMGIRCKGMHPDYLLYILKSSIVETQNSLFMNGTCAANLSAENVCGYIVPIPYVHEQIKIAEYLIKRCTELDALIAAKEKTNALLKERRQSIIYEAITKGLNPDAPMKDSGIEWIGQIPEHWDMMRAKFFAEITNGSDPKTEGDIPVYGSGSESFRTCGEFKEGPVVLLGRKGATLHIPHYVEGKYWNVDTAFDVRTNEKICLLKFYYYASICFDYKLYISTTTLPSMTQYNYGNMVIPIPSIEEQAEILKFIERKLSELDQVITATEDNIQKLKEYRQSIIYEAVTGKIEV